MQLIRKRLTYANVMSSFAVFLVLAGGTAFAAGKLGKNSVGTKQLKNGAVTAAKIKNGAVNGAKVNVTTLGTVPSATTAATANSAKSADTANSAKTADIANSAKTAESANTAASAQTAGTAATAELAKSLPTLQWVDIPLQHGWQTYADEYYGGSPKATKDAEGFVHLEGAMFHPSGANEEVAGVLPPGYRPFNGGVWIDASATDGVSNPQQVALEITADGEINPNNGPGANDAFVGLNGISFYAGN